MIYLLFHVSFSDFYYFWYLCIKHLSTALFFIFLKSKGLSEVLWSSGDKYMVLSISICESLCCFFRSCIGPPTFDWKGFIRSLLAVCYYQQFFSETALRIFLISCMKIVYTIRSQKSHCVFPYKNC